MSNRKTTSVTLSEEALKMLQKAADKEGRSPSNFLENMLKNELLVDSKSPSEKK